MAEDANGKPSSAASAQTPLSAELDEHLSEVLASEPFRRSDRIKRLLSFLVQESAAGRGDQLSEYSVAHQIFNRDADFDPARDTIVRVEVRRLRQKLADFYAGPGAGSPLRIEIARGYKPEFHAPQTQPAGRRRPRYGRWAFGAVSLAAIALAVAYSPSEEQTRPANIEPAYLTTLKGLEEHPSLSPDGSQVAFAWRREGRNDYDVYIQMTDGGEPLALADGPMTEYSPAWSPDGKKIAFLQLASANAASLVIASPLGGTSRIVAEIAAPRSPVTNPPSVAWTSDCQYLIASHRESSGQPYALYRFSVSDGSKSRLTNPPVGIFGGDSNPTVSPDGERLAFARQTTIGEFELLVQPVLDTQTETVVKESVAIAGMSWASGGESLVASVGGRLRFFDLSGGDLEEDFPLEGRDGRHPSVADRSGALAYVSRVKSDSDIWRLELDRTGRSAQAAERLISSTQADSGARYSPDGRRIAFSTRRSNKAGIWLADQDGSNVAPLRGSTQSGMMERWSPQGDAIFYSAKTEGVWSIWTADLRHGEASRRTLPIDTQNACGTWSPDGRWFYFDRTVEGRREIWRQPQDGSAMERVRIGGVCPSVSPDGRYLYFAEARVTPNRLIRTPIGGGPAEVIAPLRYETNYRVTRQGVYYIPALDAEGNAEIRYLDFETGDRSMVHEVGSDVSHGLDVSPDGRYLVFSKREPPEADLMLIDDVR